MTRARALKQVIRARAAKTGERYTTARRHVLKDLQGRAAPSTRPRSTTPPRAAAAGSSKGSVSDAKSLEKTGHGLDHWFEVLDRFGAVEKGHTAAARHLYEAHHIDGKLPGAAMVEERREQWRIALRAVAALLASGDPSARPSPPSELRLPGTPTGGGPRSVRRR